MNRMKLQGRLGDWGIEGSCMYNFERLECRDGDRQTSALQMSSPQREASAGAQIHQQLALAGRSMWRSQCVELSFLLVG